MKIVGKAGHARKSLATFLTGIKYTPQNSAFVENNGERVIVSLDYAPEGYDAANEAGSGIFISENGGTTWTDKVSGKLKPIVEPGGIDRLVAGFHLSTVRLNDGRLLAMARGSKGNFDINDHIVMNYSSDNGDTWTYRESQFPGIGSGQRLVLMKLNEGPLMLVSFDEDHMFVTISLDDGETWRYRKRVFK